MHIVCMFLNTGVNGLIIQFIDLQDGSYSRGPVDIPVGEHDDSKYYISPTFKFEQVRFHSLQNPTLSTYYVAN